MVDTRNFVTVTPPSLTVPVNRLANVALITELTAGIAASSLMPVAEQLENVLPTVGTALSIVPSVDTSNDTDKMLIIKAPDPNVPLILNVTARSALPHPHLVEDGAAPCYIM